MKQILFFLFLFLPALAFAQWPAAPNKIRLGNQTTGDGLIYRTDSIPNWTPATNRDAWVAFDTVAGVLYYYEGGVWNGFAGGGGGNGIFSAANDGDTIRAEVVYIAPGTGQFTIRDTSGTAAISINENSASVFAGDNGVQAVKPLGYLLIQGADSLLISIGGSFGTAGQVIQASGDGGAFWATADIGSTWLKTELEAGNHVNIEAVGLPEFVIQKLERFIVTLGTNLGEDILDDPTNGVTLIMDGSNANESIYKVSTKQENNATSADLEMESTVEESTMSIAAGTGDKDAFAEFRTYAYSSNGGGAYSSARGKGYSDSLSYNYRVFPISNPPNGQISVIGFDDAENNPFWIDVSTLGGGTEAAQYAYMYVAGSFADTIGTTARKINFNQIGTTSGTETSIFDIDTTSIRFIGDGATIEVSATWNGAVGSYGDFVRLYITKNGTKIASTEVYAFFSGGTIPQTLHMHPAIVSAANNDIFEVRAESLVNTLTYTTYMLNLTAKKL